jgi:hypothetical protein
LEPKTIRAAAFPRATTSVPRSCLRIALLALLAAFAGLVTEPAGAAIGERRIANNIRIRYDAPKSAVYRDLHATLVQARALEYLQRLLSPLRLPRPLTLILAECDGAANAWYTDGGVTVCYELVHELVKEAGEGSPPAGLERRDTIVGPLVHVFLHEVGHAVFDLLQIPIFGREEDAADQFAGYLMLQYDPVRARKLMLGTAYQYRSSVRGPDVTLPTLAFSAEHGLPQQRFFNILCVAYGADPKSFAEIREKGLVPPDRIETCQAEYGQVEHAFRKLIGPHIDRLVATKVRRALMQDVATPR